MESGKGSKLHFKHNCAMPPPEDIVERYIDGGYFVETRRYIRRLLIVSDTNPQSKNCFKSSAAIRYEKARHLNTHYHMIHPFSDGRAYWEFFICAVLMLILILIPIELSSWNIIWSVKIPKFFLDINCLLDICVNFSTGYYNKRTKKVILDRKSVAKYYITGFFVIDLLSSTPADMTMTIWGSRTNNNWYIKLFTYLKILRLLTILKYLDRFRDMHGYSIYKFKMFKLTVVFLIGFLWASILFYIVERNRDAVWLQGLNRFSAIVKCSFGVTYHVLLIGYGPVTSTHWYDMMFGMMLLTMGVMLQLFLLSQILQMVKQYNSAKNKFQHLIQQLNQYTRYKDLPESMSHRISTFVSRRIIIEKVTYLTLFQVNLKRELPTSLLMRIVGCMKAEIFLQNDVICRAGLPGESMFFIASGTVTVYTANGKEISHLSDGAYFGEISLVLENENRVASVVAIESCELYNLSRKDYHNAIEPYPELCYRIRKLARDRLHRTLKAMEEP